MLNGLIKTHVLNGSKRGTPKWIFQTKLRLVFRMRLTLKIRFPQEKFTLNLRS
jgi:hypothetical protein